ncbi:integrase domain-containing protein [Cellvibrio mixtus]|nr:integrase domain-containing protein [Cellvibrio mixtus]
MNKNLFESGSAAVKRSARSSGGRYAWCAASIMRWRRFCNFCENLDVKSIADIDYEIVALYAESISSCSISTRHNYISVINVVMRILKSHWVPVSPRRLAGEKRSFVNSNPVIIDRRLVHKIASQLTESNHPLLASVVNLGFYFGLRRREAALLELKNALHEAEQFGWIDIVRGTKGGRGRSVQRRVPVDEHQLAILKGMCEFLGERRCLVPEDQTYKKFSDYISSELLPVLKANGVSRLHNLRAAYACNRYQKISGFVAPRNQSDPLLLASSCADTHAREIITGELGHGRIEIVSSYVGRKVRKK